MIGSVRGTVLERTPTGEVLVEVGGVGYRALVPLSAFAQLEPGSQAFLFTHLHVREDAMVLFGFITREERDCFESLITVNGVGPKLALAILGVHPPNALRRALADDDVDQLCLVPGVGKRTAQRLLIDLKSKLSLPDVDLSTLDGNANERSDALNVRAEVRDALTALGYNPDEVRAALSEVRAEATVGDAVRDALRLLGARR